MNGEINNQLTTSTQENSGAVDESQAKAQNTKKYLMP